MVLEIRLSNFFSIGPEVVLDLRAGNIKTQKSEELKDNIISNQDGNILKSVALYGANASGKSNLIKAIRFCCQMVLNSHNHNENTVFNYQKFKFGGFPLLTSTFFIRFLHEDIEYEYSFGLDQATIISESLYHYPNKRRAKVFERNEKGSTDKGEIYTFGRSVIKKPLDVAESTSSKTLFLSRASQMDRDIPKSLFKFFNERFILRHSRYSMAHMDELILEYKDKLLTALALADSDIIDFKHRVLKLKGKKVQAHFETDDVTIVEEEVERLELKSFHKFNPKIEFDFYKEESEGTKKFLFMMLTILDVINEGKALLIDEIEDSLHPIIVEYIIRLFHQSNSAQLIFSTHNTNLLDLSLFRKDQIWFINKTQFGYSDLYSLFDFKDFRENMNLENAYLQGRFNSIPIVEQSSYELERVMKDGKKER